MAGSCPVQQLADGVFSIPLVPRDGINAYLLDGVLVDAGVKQFAKRILAALAGREVTAHTVTHAHIDHAGSSAEVVRELGIPFWAPAGDADDLARGRPAEVHGLIPAALARAGVFPPVTADRRLVEGDQVGAFRVVDAPGHSPGHVAFWREADRILVCGDVFFNAHPVTLTPGLRPPPRVFTASRAQNRRSMRRLAALEPSLVLFGHGPPLRDGAAQLRAVAEGTGG
jgi:glyoxylase-like metal-dependent hydrolase (beta-lactamase superfamily II)